MKKLILAFQFLTIVPLRLKGEVSEKETAGSSVYFPLVGAFQGFLIFFPAIYLGILFPSEITSALILLVLTLTNGGFHIDGLSDTFDALAVKSSGDKSTDREKRLAVMKDSVSGAIGVISIVFSILLKFLLINALISRQITALNYPLLFIMPVFSKWIMLPVMYHGKPARNEGLGKIFISNASFISLVFSFLMLTLILTAFSLCYIPQIYLLSLLKLLAVLFILLYLFSFFLLKIFTKKFGGLTGDNLGAISELSEILFLMVSIVWLRFFI